MKNLKDFLGLLILLIIVGLISIPVVVRRTNHLILIPPEKIKNIEIIGLGENHTNEGGFQNNSFEYVSLKNDKFSDSDGLRPFPWGGEIFEGQPKFKCINEGRTGDYSFQIVGFSLKDHGVLAIPDLELKPLIKPNSYYFLGVWVKYNIKKGGFRLSQQFFDKESVYPKYASFGPWIKGTSNEEWLFWGLLVKSPSESYKGDPIVELRGEGYVMIDDVYFGEVLIKRRNGGD